jgi:plasmid stabilization system protein ParE
MKKYRVVITCEVLKNADEIFDYIVVHNPRAAAKIVREFRSRIRSLSTTPRRCPLAPENGILDHDEIRHFHHGKYRIIYAVENNTVSVLEIRHGARLPRGE